MARSIHQLSWNECKRATPDNGPPYLGDGGGLYLQVRGEGKSRVFRYTDRRTSDEHWLGLGSMSTYDIVEAREKARKCRQLLAEGKDPKTERKNERAEAAHRAGCARTVKQLWDEFYDVHIKFLKEREGLTGVMRKYVLSKIGNMPIAKVKGISSSKAGPVALG